MESSPEQLIEDYSLCSMQKNLYDYSATRSDLCRHLGITKTVFSRFALNPCSYTDDRGETWYKPFEAIRVIHNTITRRGQTLAEYAEYVINQNRNASRSKRQLSKVDQILVVIHQITKDHPKARAVFERELQKIGVFLPKLNPPVE